MARDESTSLNAIHRLVTALSFYNSHLYWNFIMSTTVVYETEDYTCLGNKIVL